MAKKDVIRLGVVKGGLPLSGIWSIFRTREDIYVAPRSVAGSFKISLHASGQYRFGFTSNEKAKRFLPEEQDRAVFKWKRPSPDSPASVLLQLMFPANALLAPQHAPTLHPSLIELRIPQDGEVTVATVLETVSSFDITEIRAETYATRTLATWELEGDRKIWIVEHVEKMGDEFARGLAEFRATFPSFMASRVAGDLPDIATSHLRCFVPLTHPDLPIRFIDLEAESIRPLKQG